MKYKMFVTDLDDTLLDNRSMLSDKNKEAIIRIRKQGIKTVVCSGRSPLSLRPFEIQLGNTEPGCYGIGFNGSQVYEADSRRILHATTMDTATVHFILEHLAAFEVDILLYIQDDLYMKELNENTRDYLRRAEVPYRLVESFDGLGEDAYKVMLRGAHPLLAKIYAYMKDLVAGRCNVFFSSPGLLEFTHLDGTKGNGIMYLAGYLGIDPSEIIAMGDNFNDIPMLKAAGLGIAVVNGEPDVKDMADEVTQADNNHNAVAEIIEKYWRN